MKSLKSNISPDKSAAFLTIIADSADFPSENEIYDYLNENRIVYGLDKALISKLAQEKLPANSVLIAQGDGTTGRLDWHIQIENNHKPAITKTNRVDFKKLTSFPYIQKNTKIVSLLDDIQIKKGRNISGEEIEPGPDELQLPKYENVSITEDQKTLIARVSGYIFWRDNFLTMEDVLHIKGNVDYSTGNLKLKGPVIIDGDVRSGFSVETDGSIFVGGSVDAANLFSQNGDITITRGVLGQGRAKILCGGNLKCGFIQDANVAVQKDVTLEKYALNSIISSGGVIRANGENSLIRGGVLTAEKGFDIYDVGSEKAVQTELKIRSYTEGESQSQLWQVNRKKSSYYLRLSSLNKRKDFLLILKKGIEKLSTEKLSELNFTQREIERLKKKLGFLENVEIRLQKETSVRTIQKEIKVHGTLHKNVRVDIGGAFFKCEDPVSGVRLIIYKDEIILESLKEPSSRENDVYVPGK